MNSRNLPQYSKAFFEGASGNLGSARIVAPLLYEWLKPASIVDVGCGTGAWLKAFQECGVEDVMGFDGDWVDDDQILIAPEKLHRCNLTEPIPCDRRFSLAVSLEVAEHLPAESADSLVESLTRLADVVLFSAAIPHQGGTHHKNEQWPAYWIERFRARGYRLADCLRPRLWQEENLRWWYAQNIVLFLDAERWAEFPAVTAELARHDWRGLPLVHPTKFAQVADQRNYTFTHGLRILWRSWRNWFSRS